jgi:hypothetical protein
MKYVKRFVGWTIYHHLPHPHCVKQTITKGKYLILKLPDFKEGFGSIPIPLSEYSSTYISSEPATELLTSENMES